MKQISTFEDFNKLKYGDTVYFFEVKTCIGFRFVGVMPGSERYFIFSKGENLKYVYISNSDYPISSCKFFIGKYDSKFIGQLKIDYYERKIENVKKRHFKSNN